MTHPSEQQSSELEILRKRFFKTLRAEVLTWGGETLDLAWAFYPEDSAHPDHAPARSQNPRLVEDRIYLPRLGVPFVEFVSSVQETWWPSRARVNLPPEAEEGEETVTIEAICGFYGRYIGASGFCLVLEFSGSLDQKSLQLWRVDALSDGTALAMPQDEGDAFDLLAGFVDLREGWRWLITRSLRSEMLVTAEVEPGYIIGVRLGDPLSDEDPAEREDPEIEEVFSRFDLERFDTLEFLRSEDAELYPFQEERFYDWLPRSQAEALVNGEIEAFVLSQSSRFIDAIEEVAERRKVEVEQVGDEANPLLRFSRGPIWIKRPLSLPYLWTLHSARQHHEGAVEFFSGELDKIYLSSELYFHLKQRLSAPSRSGLVQLEIVDGSELVITLNDSQKTEQARINLLDWSGESVFEGKEGAERFLKLWGWDEEQLAWVQPKHRLDQCPLCERAARVQRVLRPQDDVLSARVGVQLQEKLPEGIWGYYSLVCEQHKVPIFWESASQLKEHLRQISHRVIETLSMPIELDGLPIELLWGDELAGTLLDLETRESLRERGALYAHAITPDIIALSMLPLASDQLEAIDPQVDSLLSQRSPDRSWRLMWNVELK